MIRYITEPEINIFEEDVPRIKIQKPLRCQKNCTKCFYESRKAKKLPPEMLDRMFYSYEQISHTCNRQGMENDYEGIAIIYACDFLNFKSEEDSIYSPCDLLLRLHQDFPKAIFHISQVQPISDICIMQQVFSFPFVDKQHLTFINCGYFQDDILSEINALYSATDIYNTIKIIGKDRCCLKLFTDNDNIQETIDNIESSGVGFINLSPYPQCSNFKLDHMLDSKLFQYFDKDERFITDSNYS